MNKFMSVVISLTMLLVAAGKVCAQTDSAQMAAKQYREDIEAVLNRMVEAGAVSAQARDSVAVGGADRHRDRLFTWTG